MAADAATLALPRKPGDGKCFAARFGLASPPPHAGEG